MLTQRSSSDEFTEKTVSTREKYWRHCNNYCKEFIKYPYLHSVNPCEQTISLTEFFARMCTGSNGQRYQIRVQCVMDALTTISRTCLLVGEKIIIYQIEKEKTFFPLKGSSKNSEDKIPRQYLS